MPNASEATAGSGPASTVNCSNCPGAIALDVDKAVHSASVTALVTLSPSSVTSGLASVVVCVAIRQPALGSTDTAANGGSCTATFVVLALSLSVGTEKVSTASAPAVAFGLVTDTCAEAGQARTNTNTPTSAA